MSKLILTTSHSGCGSLRVSRIADAVREATHRLVWGPVPAINDGGEFLQARDELARSPGADWAYWTEWDEHAPAEDEALDPSKGSIHSSSERAVWAGLLDVCRGLDMVELWIDPLPNAQLILAQLLTWLGQHPSLVERISLVHADEPLGNRPAGHPANLAAERHQLSAAHLELARATWTAFTHPTPEAWLALSERDLSLFPYLRSSVQEVLEELPDVRTGLGATEAILLALIARGDVAPLDVFPGYRGLNRRRVFEYWEVGKILDWLAAEPLPAVLGLGGGPFSLAMHDTRERQRRFQQSRLSLSDFGRRLAAGQDDIARYVSICRWWGGTLLTSEALWRWDAYAGKLIAPL